MLLDPKTIVQALAAGGIQANVVRDGYSSRAWIVGSNLLIAPGPNDTWLWSTAGIDGRRPETGVIRRLEDTPRLVAALHLPVGHEV